MLCLEQLEGFLKAVLFIMYNSCIYSKLFQYDLSTVVPFKSSFPLPPVNLPTETHQEKHNHHKSS